MFGIAIISAIGIGYLLKGHLSNLRAIQIKGVWLIGVAFGVELLAKMLLHYQVLSFGPVTYGLHFLTYLLLGVVVYLNKEQRALVVMGIGFLLNGLVIFSNGGIMPVGVEALNVLGMDLNSPLPGLYTVMNDLTHFEVLADIITVHFIKFALIISLGDIILCLGMMALIIENMLEKK